MRFGAASFFVAGAMALFVVGCTSGSDLSESSSSAGPEASVSGVAASFDDVVGEWTLMPSDNEVLGLGAEAVLSLSVSDPRSAAVPLRIELTLGCNPVGGATSPEEPLTVTEVTMTSVSCGAVDRVEQRVAEVVLDGMPSATLDGEELDVETSAGVVRFQR